MTTRSHRGAAASLAPWVLALVAAGCGPTAIVADADASTAGADADPGVCQEPPGAVIGHHVRALYLVPSDRSPVPARIANLEQALRHVQQWFAARSTDGLTYLTHAPTVEVVELSREASYYATNDSGGDERRWFFENVVEDAFDASAAQFNDPYIRWVFAIEAESGCEQLGRISSGGVVLLSGPDLDVLAGEPRTDTCGGQAEVQPRCPQVGQVALLLGTAFGLRRPPGCADDDGGTPCDESELMERGADSYPNATLAEENHDRLADSPFFRPLNPCPLACDRAVDDSVDLLEPARR